MNDKLEDSILFVCSILHHLVVLHLILPLLSTCNTVMSSWIDIDKSVCRAEERQTTIIGTIRKGGLSGKEEVPRFTQIYRGKLFAKKKNN